MDLNGSHLPEDSKIIMKLVLSDGRRETRSAGSHSSVVRSWVSVNRSTLELGLWLLVAATLVLDAQTTTVGLQRGFVESNALMHTVFSVFDVSAIWAVKLIALAFAFGCRAALPPEDRLIVPASLGLPWAVATLSNLSLLAPF